VQGFDPRQYVIVEQPGATLPTSAPAGVWPSPVDDIQYSPNEVSVEASPSAASWLVLADSYFPGWKAYFRPQGASGDEEKPLAIQLVDGNFRGVQLPAGSWTIRFKYTPDSFKLGGIISLIAAVTLVFGLGVFAWRYFYQESALDSTARRVAKNSLAPLALNLFNRAIDFAFAAFMLRVLGPDDAGKYYYAIIIFGWFDIITNYGLNALLIRDVARDRDHANRYLVNTTILRLALGIVVIPVLAALLLLRQVLPSFFLPFGLGSFQPDRLSADTLWAIALLVLAAAPGTVATGLSALFTAYEKAEYPAAVATLTTLVKVSLGTIALVLGLGFVGLAGLSIVVNVVTLAVLGVLAWRLFFRPRFEFDLGFQRHAMRESFPLMLNNLLATLFFKVDVTLLEPIQGTTQVGWYSAGYKFIDAFNLVPSLFTFALFPVMSRQAHEDRLALRRSYTLAIKLLVGAALPLALVTTAAAPLLVGILGGSAFLPYGAVALAILVWSIPFGWINSVTNYVLIALGQQHNLTRAFGISLVFNVALNLLFLPRFGFQAAAAITIASELFEGALFYLYLRHSLGGAAWPRALWQLWVSGAVMAAVALALWHINPYLATVAGLAVYGGALIVLRPFSAEEEGILAGILPSRMRGLLRLRR
jgi:O-antigen/teichoic acid export membrane protein